jgi:glycosyltransferase involved in cell wall biosynthesis
LLNEVETADGREGSVETLTVVIPTKDAAPLLAGALETVAFADEIIVVDMHSRDGTAEVCRRYPQCRLVQRDGHIHSNVNHGFELATKNWVMRMDTDERITPELAEEIKGILSAPPDGVVGFSFWERPVMLGRELRHGFGRKHHRQMLFRRGAARFPAKLQHEAFETSGVWLEGRNGYMHYNYSSVADYLRKIDYYTERDSAALDLPASAPPVRGAIIEPLRAFYLYYLKWKGYRDGWVGFVDASMRAIYQFVQWAKLRERWEREKGWTP